MSLCFGKGNYDLFIKRSICQNVFERAHDVRSILNSFKSLIKPFHQKRMCPKFNMKKDDITYRRNYLHQKKKKKKKTDSMVSLDFHKM